MFAADVIFSLLEVLLVLLQVVEFDMLHGLLVELLNGLEYFSVVGVVVGVGEPRLIGNAA